MENEKRQIAIVLETRFVVEFDGADCEHDVLERVGLHPGYFELRCGDTVCLNRLEKLSTRVGNRTTVRCVPRTYVGTEHEARRFMEHERCLRERPRRRE